MNKGSIFEISPVKCKVNNKGDLFMNFEARPFIGSDCTIIKRTKSGLIQVFLNSNPKIMISVAQQNIDLS